MSSDPCNPQTPDFDDNKELDKVFSKPKPSPEDLADWKREE